MCIVFYAIHLYYLYSMLKTLDMHFKGNHIVSNYSWNNVDVLYSGLLWLIKECSIGDSL